ncbi:hypothetical protein [Desulfonatronovibrio magnus]|uniref:hypothetical protein n=1 Tax=Desulfonatronovibrio magnus TaxID=698827 RepID=UPI0005EAD6E3|nr:hypothetical protein [Desulfonatronovibrio magnus]
MAIDDKPDVKDRLKHFSPGDLPVEKNVIAFGEGSLPVKKSFTGNFLPFLRGAGLIWGLHYVLSQPR